MKNIALLSVIGLFSLSCGQKKIKLENSSSEVKDILDNSNCAESLREKMEKSGCSQMRIKHLSEYDVMIRCHKNDNDRNSEWDTNIFRISPKIIIYMGEEGELVKKHTICEDKTIRIESYPPNLKNIE